MGYFNLSGAMRRVLLDIAFNKYGCVRQKNYPFHTLKALRDRGLLDSMLTDQHGCLWRATRAGTIAAHLLREIKDGES